MQDPVRKDAEELLRTTWTRAGSPSLPLVSFHNAARELEIIPPVGSMSYYETVIQYMEGQEWIAPYTAAPSSAEFYEVTPEGRKIATGGG